MNYKDVKEELAEALRAVDGMSGRVLAFVPDIVTPPQIIVSYPESGTFDESYGRGMDSYVIPVLVVEGRPNDRTALDRLSAYMSGEGGSSIKRAVELHNSEATAYDDARVARFEVDPLVIGGVDYISAIFDVEVFGQGDPNP